MRSGWDPRLMTSHFALRARTQRGTTAASPWAFLLCMGLFSQFCVWALRSTAHSVSKTRVNALAEAPTPDAPCWPTPTNGGDCDRALREDLRRKMKATLAHA